jgi:membrane-associated phospholipid phosphatase
MIALVATALGPTWAAIVLWIWAPLVALARVAMGVHYLSDIVAGAIVGIVVGMIGLQIYTPILVWVNSWLWFPLW